MGEMLWSSLMPVAQRQLSFAEGGCRAAKRLGSVLGLEIGKIEPLAPALQMPPE